LLSCLDDGSSGRVFIASTCAGLPHSGDKLRAITKQKREIEELADNPPKTINGLLGIEGRAAFAYFLAWQKVPLQWKGLNRRPIPKDWHQIGPRTSANGKVGVNRHASHPVIAMLNYAYAILESHARMEIVAQGYDPSWSSSGAGPIHFPRS
jgi:CRISPR-associated protein Cas1